MFCSRPHCHQNSKNFELFRIDLQERGVINLLTQMSLVHETLDHHCGLCLRARICSQIAQSYVYSQVSAQVTFSISAASQ